VLPAKLWKGLLYLKLPTSSYVISKLQHDFKSVVLACLNDRTVMLQDYQSVTVAYIDIAKAFVTVSHKKLIYNSEQTLWYHGMFVWLNWK